MIIQCAALINGLFHIPEVPATYLLSVSGRLQRISTANNLREEVSRDRSDHCLLHWLYFADPKLAQYLRGNYRPNRKIFDVVEALPETVTRYYNLRIKIEQRDLTEVTGNELLQKCDRILQYRAIICSVSPTEKNRTIFYSERSKFGNTMKLIEKNRNQKISTKTRYKF